MYCKQCGNEVEPQDTFCKKCGNEVSQTSDHAATDLNAGAPVTKSAAYDTVRWVLNAQRKISFFKRVTCNVIFMADKALFAHLSPQRQKSENEKAYQVIKANGGNILKRSAAMLQYWLNYSKRYYTMTAEQILSEDTSNFLIPYQSIKKVLFKCESTTIDSDGSASGSQGKLKITLSDGKVYNFSHQRPYDKAVKEMLAELLNGKLKYKKQKA